MNTRGSGLSVPLVAAVCISEEETHTSYVDFFFLIWSYEKSFFLPNEIIADLINSVTSTSDRRCPEPSEVSLRKMLNTKKIRTILDQGKNLSNLSTHPLTATEKIIIGEQKTRIMQ